MTSLFLWYQSLRRHWLAGLVTSALAIMMMILVILYAPRQYRSVSRLLLRVGYESATLDPTVSVVGNPNAPVKTREDEIETEIDVMHSRAILEDVVDRLGHELILEEKLDEAGGASSGSSGGLVSAILSPLTSWIGEIDPVSQRERAVRALEKGFSISAGEKSSVVKVEYKSKSPKVAQLIVATWIDAFLAHHADVNRTEGTYQFFVEQETQLKQQLTDVHQAIRKSKTKAGFTTIAGHQKILEIQLEKVSSELYKVEADLIEAAVRSDTYGDLLDTTVARTVKEQTTGVERDLHNEMRSKLFNLEVQENEFASRYTDNHPKLVSIRQQLGEARKIVEAQNGERVESREIVNPMHQQLSENRIIDLATAKSLIERKSTLVQQRNSLLEQISELNQHEEDLAGLDREAKVLEARYQLHSVMLEQARLNDELQERQITSINVAQPATLEERPVSPSKALCAFTGMLAAMGLALGVPVLLDFRSYLPTEESVAPSVTDHIKANWGETIEETPRRARPSVAMRIDGSEMEASEQVSDERQATRPR